jgi:hypothetical protein
MTTGTFTDADIEQVFPPRVVNAFRRTLEVVQEEDPQFELSLTLDMATSLALKRSQLLGREVMPLDVEFALSIFCWWPLKPPASQEFQERVRSRSQSAFRQRNLLELERLVPATVLMLSPESLYHLQTEGRDDLLLSPY